MKNFWIDNEDFQNTRQRCSFGLLEIGGLALGAELGLGGLFGLGAGAAEGAAGGLGVSAAIAGSAAAGGEGLAALGALGGEELGGVSALGFAGPEAGLTPNAIVGQGFEAAADPIAAFTGDPAGGLSAASVQPVGGLPGGAIPDPTSLGSGTFSQYGASVPGSDVLAAGQTSTIGQFPGAAAAPGATPGADIASLTGAGAGGSGGPGAAGLAGPDALAGAAKPDFLSKLGTGALDSVTKNPLGLALGAGGLAYAMSNKPNIEGLDAIRGNAADLNAQGKQLASYLQSGTLPEGLKNSLTQATNAAKAKAISNAASQGLSTDPTKNTALAATLAQIDQQATISTAQIGQQLLTTGINESGMASQLYTQLAQIDQTQTANIGKAIANFAGALNSGGTKIQIGGTA